MTNRSFDYANGVVDAQQSLRNFFLSIFLTMGVGLAITGGVSFWIAGNPGMMETLFSLQPVMEDGEQVMRPAMSRWWIAAAGIQLLAVIFLSARLSSLSKIALPIYLGYTALTGVTLAPIIYTYTAASVATTFFVAGGMFFACALFGHVTKINLRPLGTFLFMALVGLLIALVANFFLQSVLMDYLISAAGVMLFAVLTAFDMQRLEEMYEEEGGSSSGLVILGALKLYLDFLNLFLFLLRFLGVRKD